MSYRGNNSRQRGFSVTARRDGSRAFYGDHDDRWDNSNSSQNRGGYQNSQNRGSGGYRGNRGRGRGGTGFKHFNPRASRFRYNRPGTDRDGDVSMSGDSSSSRGFSNNSRGNRRGSGRGRPQQQQLNFRKNQQRWFRVMVPFGAKMSKQELFELIRSNYEGEFKPVKYTAEEQSQRAIFYIEGGHNVEGLKGLSRRLSKPDGHKLVLHITPAPDFGHMDEGIAEKLKYRMSERYDPATQSLNLSGLYNDEALNKENVYLALNKITTMEVVTQIISEHIPELTGLDVSNNRLLSLSHMKFLVKATPGMKSLNLANNQIRSVEELVKLKGWNNITELVLQGNELRNNYSSLASYASAVRKHFPKVLKLDNQDLPPPVTFDIGNDAKLPASKDCHFINDEIKTLVVSFVKEFYTIYDSDRRRDLMPAYHENAQFSMCVGKNPLIERQIPFNLYLDECRNLKKIGHLDSGKLVKKTKSGVLGVVSLLETLPKTSHDLTSFKLDVSIASPTMLSFVVHGMFKETESRGERPPIRLFSRTFITVPSGPGMVITNDMLTLSNATYEQAKNAFKGGAPTPSSSPVSSSQGVESPGTSTSASNYTPEQMQMVQKFTQESGMNPNYSLKCLEENGWDYQRAGQNFSSLNSQGKIPADAFVKIEGGHH